MLRISRSCSNPARSSACCSGVIGALFSGVHQFGVRWYTVSDCDVVGDDGDDLHAAGGGSDDGDALVLEVDGLRRPQACVVRLAAEGLASGDVGGVGHREDPGRGNDEAGGHLRSVGGDDVPRSGALVIVGGRDPGAEADVPAQVEAVDHVVEVALGLRLGGEVLAPLPLVEELAGEEVAVGVALRVEAGARVTVPVPGAPDPVAGLHQQGREPRFAGAVQLVDAGDPRAHDEHVDVRGRLRAGGLPGRGRRAW